MFVFAMISRTQNPQLTPHCAYWLTAVIRLCQTSVNSGDDMLTRLAFWVQAGHDHSGIDSMAIEGASSVKVPPWRMGNLQTNQRIKELPRRSREGLWLMVELMTLDVWLIKSVTVGQRVFSVGQMSWKNVHSAFSWCSLWKRHYIKCL